MYDEKLTNGLHDELWIKGARSLIEIDRHLNNANVIARNANSVECLKELYAIGEVTKENYTQLLCKILNDSGFKLTIEDLKS